MSPRIETYQAHHFTDVEALWREVFPNDQVWNLAENAIPELLRVTSDLLLVAVLDDKVVGSIMAGYDGHRGWIYRVAVRAALRHQRVGSLLVEEAEKRLIALGCNKINLQILASNAAVVSFYERLGYVVEERISMGKRIARHACSDVC